MEINSNGSQATSHQAAASKHETRDALNTPADQPNSTVGPEDNGLRKTESVQPSERVQQDSAADDRVQADKRQGHVIDITV